MLTYEQITAVTQTTPFLLILAFIVLFPIILYLIIASNVKARTKDGRKLSKSMLSNLNAFIPIFIWLFIQGGLFLLLVIFPVWAK